MGEDEDADFDGREDAGINAVGLTSVFFRV